MGDQSEKIKYESKSLLAIEDESFDVAEYVSILRTMGLEISDEDICKCFDCKKDDNLKILIRNGLSLETIISRFIQIPNNSLQYSIVKYFAEEISQSNIIFDPVLLHKFVTKLINYDLFRQKYHYNMSDPNIITLESIQKFISMGLDVHYSNDYMFLDICVLNDLSLVKYFVEDLVCDIHTENSAALIVAVKNKYLDIMEYLLDCRIIINDNIMQFFFDIDDVESIKILLKYSADSDLIAQKYLSYHSRIASKLFAFVETGVDITQVVSTMYKN